MVGASSLAAGHLSLVPELKAELARLGRPDIMVVVGGVVPDEDAATLLRAGVAFVFPPGTAIPAAAERILLALGQARGFAQKAPEAYTGDQHA